MIEIIPSILSADFTRLGEQIAAVERGGASMLHLDVMDGHFVPNLTIGPPVVKSVRKITRMTLDVHLMIVNPDKFIQEFRQVGAAVLSVHYEACTHLHRTIHAIKDAGMKAGVVLNPHTGVHVLDDILIDLDLVLVMSVNPGYGGQKFISQALQKVAALKKLIIQKDSKAKIEVDGGVDLNNAASLVKAGADVLVAGSAVFSSSDPVATIAKLKSLNH